MPRFALSSFARITPAALKRALAAYVETPKTRMLLSGSTGSLVLRACALVFRVLLSVQLARMLGASGYGAFAFAITWLTFLSIPATMGLDQVVWRYAAVYYEGKSWPVLKGLLRFALGIGLLASSGVGLVAAGVVAWLPGIDWELKATFLITFGVLPFVVLAQIRQASIRGLHHPVLAQLPENIVYPALFSLILVVGHSLTQRGLSAPEVAMANAAGWAAAFILGTVLLLRILPSSIRSVPPSYRRSEWLVMVPPLIFIGIVYNAVSRADILILGFFLTSREVGIYAIATRGAELMLFMYEAMTLAGGSLFSSIYATGNMNELQRFTNLVTRSILWSSLPVFIVFMAIGPWILSFFGAEFTEGAMVMRVLTTTFFVSSLGGFVIIMLYMTGHQKDVAIVMGLAGGLNVGLSFLLIPMWGMMGAAVASGTALLFMKGTLVLILYKRIGIVSLPFAIPGIGPIQPRSPGSGGPGSPGAATSRMSSAEGIATPGLEERS